MYRTAGKSELLAPVGVHHVLELYGCPAGVLNDATLLSDAIENAAAISKTKLLKQLVHAFPGQGVTALALLAESHIAIHTWPEHGYAAVDLFACGERARPEAGCAYLIEALEARRHTLSTIRRGPARAPIPGAAIEKHGAPGPKNPCMQEDSIMTPTQVPKVWMDEPLTSQDVYRRSLTNFVCQKRSPLQEICIADAGAYGKSLILDGQLQASLADEFLYHEALVHPAMIQLSSPRDILIIGGGDGGAAREALRWRSVRHVTVVEVDREVVDACREHLPEIHQNAFRDPRLEIVIDDGLRFLRNTNRKWDVIVFDLPDPAEGVPWLELYQRECFEMVRGRLSRGGSLVLQAGPVSPVNVAPLTRIVRDLKPAFPFVHVYSTFVPSFGIPLAFVLAAARPVTACPSPEVVDRLIAERIHGKLRLLDGRAFLGLMQTPVYLREAVRSDPEEIAQIPCGNPRDLAVYIPNLDLEGSRARGCSAAG